MTSPDSAAPRPNAEQQPSGETLHGRLRPATIAVAGGRPAPERDAPVGPSIVLSSTYRGAGEPVPGERMYGRASNPTWDDFESVLGQLEGSPLPSLAFASGVASISAVLSLVPLGGRVVVPVHVYMGTMTLVREAEQEGRIRVDAVEVTDTDAVLAAAEGADLVLLESPTNPMLEVADLPEILAGTRRLGVLSCVDSTFTTPLLQRPLAWGADLVVHSATKYLAGHSDVVLGAATAVDPELRQRLHAHRSRHGAIPGPFETWLALRGIRTLSLRVERAGASAAEIARRLLEQPGVRAVRYPGLTEDPGHERAAQQLQGGFGAIVGLEVDGDAAAADRVVEALRLWVPATSLGGVESLVERRRRHPEEPRTVPESLLRLSVGIEDVEDLWEDLERALAAVVEPAAR
ncbi:trans-sulfuration enzyme family protein [Kocuria palustris]|uniref:trans-sulfuration enzyme family protein n=1 Tax=Kocuria palustris TaxID=71999 RepID=UPI00246874FC|nr:PLP-dependent transferase [Kocuria palustris]MDH5151057.1 PLP-dependent transferase [Kocuria palustris]